MLTGLAGMSWIYLETSLAWPWYSLVGSLGTFVVGVAASRLWPERPAAEAQ